MLETQKEFIASYRAVTRDVSVNSPVSIIAVGPDGASELAVERVEVRDGTVYLIAKNAMRVTDSSPPKKKKKGRWVWIKEKVGLGPYEPDEIPKPAKKKERAEFWDGDYYYPEGSHGGFVD